MPELADILHVLLLRDYNTRLVVLAAGVLGIAAGVVGTFMLLRKRALLGDALSHATLPGVGLAFILATLAGADGKSLPVLLAGALVMSMVGAGTILLIHRHTRLKEDAALGITLSVFFGAGAALLGVIQQMGLSSAAGLQSFIYGSTASMIASDAVFIAVAAGMVVSACTLLFKELKLLCFDADFAQGQGWSVGLLDATLAGLMVLVVVVGLQAVGLVLIVAMLIIPAAAARFWTERLLPMTAAAAVIGATSAALGAAVSALYPDLPSGAMIVLVALAVFTLSVLTAPARGVIPRALRRQTLNRRIDRQHLLRAMYEILESTTGARHDGGIAPTRDAGFDDLLQRRSWEAGKLARLLRSAQRDGLVRAAGSGRWLLTQCGADAAVRVVRNYRLWEVYLITYADIAPNHVDRDADRIEHVLSPILIRELEVLLEQDGRTPVIPPNPHKITPTVPGSRSD
ncbi:MAG: metal ABC transporter permease [Thiotrichales bacterium]|nr:metal ABC transporter permease [Thiotrichales bacterium]